MSVVPSSNTSPAIPDDDMTGLEDVESTDFAMPRLSIDHDTGEFVDSLSGERHEKLTGVILGLVKQRVLWPPEMGDDNDPPLCRSYNFHDGHPDGDNFPWRASGFDSAELGEGGVLACAACPLKDWGSHPNQDKQWCAEQHVYPILLPAGDGLAPALFTVQRSGIKSSRAYLSSFARSKTPLYTAQTTLTLTGHRRGKVSYYVPAFAKAGTTDQEEWAEYAHTYRGIREFLQTPRTRDGHEGGSTSSATSSSGTAGGGKSDSSRSGGSSTRGSSSATRSEATGGDGTAPGAPPTEAGGLEDDDDLPF